MMTPPNIFAAQRFIEIATRSEHPTIAQLARSLDELALSYHDTPLGNPDDSDERPEPGSRVDQADIGARFPDLGYYGVADPLNVPGEVLVGDAIDDILDIANDLKEVVWRFDRFGADDANWHFRFLFQIHWGRHLRDLAGYLHSRIAIEAQE